MRLPQALINGYKKKRLAHAYLFYGLSAEEYLEPVRKFFQLLACDCSDAACENCVDCQQIEKMIHADLTVLNETDNEILVDDIREQIIHKAHLTPASGKRLMFWINDISRLKAESSNALLKVLEEPPGETVFVLTARSRWDCLPTIRSRCQWIRFVPEINFPDSIAAALAGFWGSAAPDDEEQNNWKKLLTAELSSDRLNWTKENGQKFLSFLLAWIHQGYTNDELEDEFKEIFEKRRLEHRLVPLLLERFQELKLFGKPLLVVNSLLEEIYYPKE